MKKVDKMRAIELRKQGYSLNEIVDLLGVSKSSASTWVRNVVLSEESEKRLLTKIKVGQLSSQKVNRARRLAKEDAARGRARIIVSSVHFDHGVCLVLCAAMYFCEGRKSVGQGVSFMNSDPGLMSLFLRTLRRSFALDEGRFRVQVHLHSYHDKDTQLIFWSKATGIPMSQFTKPYQKKNSGLHKKEGYQGCANVCYHDVTISRELKAVALECMTLDLCGR